MDSIDKLIDDLENGTIVGACDGSYYPSTLVTTAAWTLESYDGSQFISGMSTPFFSASCHGAYWAELAGLLALVHMKTHICYKHQIELGTVHIGCDNLRALSMAFEQPSFKRSPKQNTLIY